jgi:ring-1,2-phenylacetyl-CoA epoxidase subunit PaaE
MASHFRRLTIKDIRRETSECVSIAFAIPPGLQEEFRYMHGQNITLKITLDNEEIRRSYSICSSPLESELRIAVKKIINGKFSNHALNKLGKGIELEVLPPTGKFYTELNPANRKNYLALAAGSGITPLLSIIKTTLATEPESNFTLVYGNRSRDSIIFKEQLEALKNRYMNRFSLHYILSREKTESSINYGRIDPEKCTQLGEKLIDFQNADEIFICGPEEMIFSIKNWLEQQKIDKKKIHFELFTVPGEKHLTIGNPVLANRPKPDGKISKVTVKSDGVYFEFDLEFDGESILEAALKRGVDLPFACKSGVCSSCRAKLINGAVEMDVNYALEPEELNAGFILTCQSHPALENLLVDFDVK